MTIPEALALAQRYQQAGRFAEAESLCRQVLAVAPQHVDALHLLGLALHRAGRNDEAVTWLERALVQCPNHPALHSNLGEVFRKMGRLDEAVACYRRALALDARYAKAHVNLGRTLQQQGSAEDAVTAFHAALALAPDADVLNHLGNALHELDRMNEAIDAYGRALELKPDFAEASYNLGNALEKCERVEEAIAAHRRAITLRPDFAQAHANLGMALVAKGENEEALAAFEEGLRFVPGYAEVWRGRGMALLGAGRVEEALVSIRRAVELQPESVDSRNNLGVALLTRGDYTEAVTVLREVVSRAPEHVEAWNNLACSLMNQGRQVEAEEAWVKYRAAVGTKPDFPRAWSNFLLHLHYRPGVEGAEFLHEHRRWAEVHAEPLRTHILPLASQPDPERRLRIGYVSPDFREHSVAYFLEGLLAQHDPAQVEVFCYSARRVGDAMTERLRRHAARWREIFALSDAQAAELIRADGIDILVDLTGHTADHRLLVFARKPAPVQVSWLGYCDTTGMDVMDYRISDAHADPVGVTDEFHTEQLVRLPCAWCYTPQPGAPAVSPLPATESGAVTFGCFNSLAKINDEVLATWAEVLGRVPGSRLLLKAAALREALPRELVLERLARGGVSAERVEFSGALPTLEMHLDTYRRVDVALDPFPYHGTTTTCEALWMGVPVVTLAGAHHAARVGVSLLQAVGLREFIAHDRAEYVELAVRLTRDLAQLAEMRTTLRERMKQSRLLDARGFARSMEEAYREMWRKWCAKPGA